MNREIGLSELSKRIDEALEIALNYAQIDGSHHKMWVIDQMTRKLLGEDYESWVAKYMFGDKSPVEAVQQEEYYVWDVGIAP